MLAKMDVTTLSMRRALTLTASALLAFSAAAAELSNDEIRRLLIGQSLAQYSGNCPCPYNVDRAGRTCGKRSAYSKPGGYAPLCFPSDVTQEMVEKYKQKS
jgi:hypothetical protein